MWGNQLLQAPIALISLLWWTVPCAEITLSPLSCLCPEYYIRAVRKQLRWCCWSSFFQMRKQRLSEVQKLGHSHTAGGEWDFRASLLFPPVLHCFLYDRILVLLCIVVFYKVALTRESWDRGVMSKGLGIILPIACSEMVSGTRNGILILGCCVRESRTMPAIKLEEGLLCNRRCFRLSSGTYLQSFHLE